MYLSALEKKGEKKEEIKEKKEKEKKEKIKGIMLRGIQSTLNKQCVSPRWRKDFYLNNNNNNKVSESFLIIFSVKLEQNKAER